MHLVIMSSTKICFLTNYIAWIGFGGHCWTDKKLAPNCSLQTSKTLALPHRNTMQLKDGPGLRPAAACAERCSLNRQETSCKFAPFKPPKPLPRHIETPRSWRTDQACGLRLPVPNVALWTDKKLAANLHPSSLQNLCLATSKHHAAEGRIRPAACGYLCRTLLCEPTRN